MSDYQNRGGEIWERCKDEQWRELFAEDAIGRLMHLERELAEAIAQRDELLKTADAWFEAWNSGHEMDWKEAKEMEKLIIKLKGKSHD